LSRLAGSRYTRAGDGWVLDQFLKPGDVPNGLEVGVPGHPGGGEGADPPGFEKGFSASLVLAAACFDAGQFI